MITWIKLIFTSVKIGNLLKILLLKSGCIIAAEILNKENQEKAYEFVKELNKREDIDNTEKQRLFNERMLEYAKSLNKKLSTSIINCLRELAVNAIKCELSKETEDTQETEDTTTDTK